MNRPTHPGKPDIPADEWKAQERAMRAERLGLSDDADDENMRDYRLVARALRQPLPDPLPADFAERVAQQAGAGHAMREWPERLLGTGLLVVLLLTAIVQGAWHGASWWQALSTWVPPDLLIGRWTLSLLACLGLTVMLYALPTGRRMPR